MTRLKAVKDTRRKRRLARLPSAILLDDTISEILREDINGLTPKFEPTMDDWQHMGADGFSLDAADQEEICKLVSSYFQSQPFEKSAPFVADKKNGWTRSKGRRKGFTKRFFPVRNWKMRLSGMLHLKPARASSYTWRKCIAY